MSAKHRIELPAEVRAHLEQVICTGSHHAHTIQHAQILLLADEGPAWNDEQIAAALQSSVPTVERIRRRFVKEGLEAALRVRKDVPGSPPKIDGAAEAHLIALACSAPPEGRPLDGASFGGSLCRTLRDGGARQPRDRAPDAKKTGFNLTERSNG